MVGVTLSLIEVTLCGPIRKSSHSVSFQQLPKFAEVSHKLPRMTKTCQKSCHTLYCVAFRVAASEDYAEFIQTSGWNTLLKINIKLEVLSLEKAWDVIQRDIILKLLIFSVTECYYVKTRSGWKFRKSQSYFGFNTKLIVYAWCLWGIGWPLLENSWKFLVAQLAVGLLSLTASWLRFKPIKGCGMELWQCWSTFIMIDRDLKLSWLWFSSKCSLLRIFVFAQKDQQ